MDLDGFPDKYDQLSYKYIKRALRPYCKRIQSFLCVMNIVPVTYKRFVSGGVLKLCRSTKKMGGKEGKIIEKLV